MPLLNMNKDRLYVAVYPTGKQGEYYHWAFIITSKANDGVGEVGYRHHAVNKPVIDWAYDTSILKDASVTLQLLARVLVAKIDDKAKLAEIFKRIEVKQNDPGWTCRIWAKTAWETAVKSGALSKDKEQGHFTWAQIEATTKEYVAKKKAEGRYDQGQNMMAPKPTFDMLQGKEILD